MIKFMDEITEVLTGAVRTYMEWAGEIAIYILGLLANSSFYACMDIAVYTDTGYSAGQ